MNKNDRKRLLNRIGQEYYFFDRRHGDLAYFKGAVCGLLSFISGQDPKESNESLAKKGELFDYIRGLKTVTFSDVSEIQCKIDQLYFGGEFEEELAEDVVI